MSVNGCINPSAVNYDPSADTDDGSCYFYHKVDGTCYRFNQVAAEEIVDQSFTVSYSVEGNNWVFFHDYIPDYYFHTREKLHLVKGPIIYTANEGDKGTYLGNNAAPFFVDVVFRNDSEMTLDTIKWMTEIITPSMDYREFYTLTHITVWNSYQTSGRIPVNQTTLGIETSNLRKTKSSWTFNDFRDILSNERGNNFLTDIFHDFRLIDFSTNPDMPWYNKKLFEDLYFIVRFEFSNGSEDDGDNGEKDVFLHEVSVDVTPSER